jgi:hypothetical protein
LGFEQIRECLGDRMEHLTNDVRGRQRVAIHIPV